MTRQAIIEHTVEVMKRLPESKAAEISDFANFIDQRYEDQQLTTGLQQLVSEGDAFRFVEEDEVLYSLGDLKQRYNAEG